MSTSVIESLRSNLGGALVAEGDAGYDEARVVYNAMIDRRPAAIVRCQSTEDVAAVVRAAAESGTDLAIRGGGHSVPGFGTADGALVVDLGDLTSVDVDPGILHRRGRRRSHLGDVQRRGGGARSCDDRWDHLDHGRRRTDARRGNRLPRSGPWPVVRQPALGRSGARRREGGHCERGRGARLVLGPPRRGRQLRRRDEVRLPVAPCHRDLRRPDVLRALRRVRPSWSTSTRTFEPLPASSAGSPHSRSRRHCPSCPRTGPASRSWP